MSDLIPISDAQAEALKAALELGSQSLETARGFGAAMAKVFGTLPEDIVGYLGGDFVKVRRAENMMRMVRLAESRLADRGVEYPQPLSLSVAIPLMQGSADESRPEVLELWVRLLAAAMDPERAQTVRRAFVEVVKKLEPTDARVLASIPEPVIPSGPPALANYLASQLSLRPSDVGVSLYALADLDIIRDSQSRRGEASVSMNSPMWTPFGVELMRVLRD